MYRLVSQTPKIKNLFTINANKLTKVFSVFMFVFLFLGNPAIAMTPEQQAQLDAITQQNAAFKTQLDSLYAQERTLANEIAIADAQAQALQRQINDTQIKINITNEQLATTAAEIKAAEAELARQKANLNEYIKVMYMDGNTSQIELVLTSENFSDFVDKSEYLDTMQAHIQEAMTKINQTKAELEAKKKQLDVDKASLDVLRESQLAQSAAMDNQINYKNHLLSTNKTNQGSIQEQITINNANSYTIRCLASGTCGSSANGDLRPVNNVDPYYDQRMYGPNVSYDGGYHSFYADGCLVTSLAMAHNKTPKDEADDHTYYVDGNGYHTGWMNTDSTSGTAISWSTANDILSHGGKVVMGLNIGHFVLAVGYDANTKKYLINDPYPTIAPNGYDKSQVVKLLRP